MLSDLSEVPRLFWSLGLVPVQTWIAEARRSRDLLAGSRILPWMMGDLLASLRNAGTTFLLPQLEPSDLQSLEGRLESAISSGSTAVPNRASGWLPIRLDAARTLFESLEKRLEERWGDLVQEVTASADRSAHDLWRVVREAVGRPVCPFQLVWVAQEVSGSDEDGVREVNRLYTAVKRSRPIGAHHGAPVRKCGQCGRREAMGGPDPVKWRFFQKLLFEVDEVRRGLRIDAGEYLCPLCTLRRFAGYMRDDAFPSTSAIAARDWLASVKSQEDLRALLAALQDSTERVPGYEARWVDRAPLYYERSVKRELREARGQKDEARLDALAAVLQHQVELARAIDGYNRSHNDADLAAAPAEYLAVLMFDGDDMGRRLHQDLEVLPRRIRDFQTILASRLGGEAEGVLGLTEPFYLGGDEGLVLAPVGAALAVATSIRSLWAEIFGEAGPEAPTLSMGMAIFDRERPLYAAIETARSSLEAAKRQDGKNAMTVSVQTASGSVWSATGRWQEEWRRLATVLSLIDRGGGERGLSAGWPHDVEAFLRTLSPAAFAAGEATRRAIREEVKRLTFRRVTGASGDSSSGSESAKVEIWRKLDGDTWWSEEPPEGVLEGLPEQLHLVAFLARQAGAPPNAGPPAQAASED